MRAVSILLPGILTMTIPNRGTVICSSTQAGGPAAAVAGASSCPDPVQRIRGLILFVSGDGGWKPS